VNHGLVIPELTLAQGDVEPASVEEGPALETVSVEVVRSCGFSPRDGSRMAGAVGAVIVIASGAGLSPEVPALLRGSVTIAAT